MEIKPIATPTLLSGSRVTQLGFPVYQIVQDRLEPYAFESHGALVILVRPGKEAEDAAYIIDALYPKSEPVVVSKRTFPPATSPEVTVFAWYEVADGGRVYLHRNSTTAPGEEFSLPIPSRVDVLIVVSDILAEPSEKLRALVMERVAPGSPFPEKHYGLLRLSLEIDGGTDAS